MPSQGPSLPAKRGKGEGREGRRAATCAAAAAVSNPDPGGSSESGSTFGSDSVFGSGSNFESYSENECTSLCEHDSQLEPVRVCVLFYTLGLPASPPAEKSAAGGCPLSAVEAGGSVSPPATCVVGRQFLRPMILDGEGYGLGFS